MRSKGKPTNRTAESSGSKDICKKSRRHVHIVPEGRGFMEVREYRSRDFKVLARFYGEFFNEMRVWQGWEQLKLSDDDAVATAKESLDPQSRVFVAEDTGQLVGFARVQLWDGAYFVREVFVAKPYRRRKVGSKLLAKCEEHVRKQGETSLYLTVEPQHVIS
ncbi:MAG: GNAT family N-acetyltransferase, partial [Candidatus Bathyarchaeota archaeon]|nr:GNAT family N-acetyltransferase [Candidatus Bathyarchaeota archaeon]